MQDKFESAFEAALGAALLAWEEANTRLAANTVAWIEANYTLERILALLNPLTFDDTAYAAITDFLDVISAWLNEVGSLPAIAGIEFIIELIKLPVESGNRVMTADAAMRACLELIADTMQSAVSNPTPSAVFILNKIRSSLKLQRTIEQIRILKLGSAAKGILRGKFEAIILGVLTTVLKIGGAIAFTIMLIEVWKAFDGSMPRQFKSRLLSQSHPRRRVTVTILRRE